jgi:branched-chain amino acid aminotransferase
MLKPINFAAFAPLYDAGVDLTVSLQTRHFAGAVDARVKMTDRLALVRGELKGGRLAGLDGGVATRAWTIIFNDDGTLAETHGANLALVSEREIVRPPRHQALEGISLDTTARLAAEMGLATVERPITLYDVINADEVFITSTSFSILPVSAIDGIRISHKREVFRELLARWIEFVGFDFVAQARAGVEGLSARAAAPVAH